MSVKVAVRVRPFNQREKFLGCLNCIQMKDKTTILINPRDRSQKQHQFTFDYSFWSHDGYEELQNGYLYPIDDRFVDQKKIFKYLGEDILKNAWNGFNCCLFAYGQTGAGKSYSMIGYEANRGIVPMVCQKIFQGIQRNRIKGKKQFQVAISMIQIYNQKVQDLFVHTSKRPVNGLKIRQSKKVGVYVQGITRYQVHSYAEIERRMEEGAKNRSLASTLMNEYSSRAHTIVMIEFIQKQFITEQKMNKKSSMLNLVDLAGSERIAKTGISDKDRMKQASQINKSLHTLGRVIEHLAQLSLDKGKVVQIPYRQSALTRILETALGGNSVTTMICAVSPANDNYQETLSTLRYADQTKKIKNKPIINQSAVDKIIRQLRQENERLKQMLRIAKLKGINLQEGENGNIFANMQQIQRQIRKNMQSFAINTQNIQGVQDDESLMLTQFMDVPDPNDFYSGELSFDTTGNTSTTTIGNARANAFITNLSEDRLLSFKIKYSCEQQLYVGNKNLKEGGRNKLVLCGLGVQDRHARLYEKDSRYFIQALNEQASQYTLVNGKPVDKTRQIFHNDRIIFGTNSVFLFKNFNAKKLKSNQKRNSKEGTGIGISTNKFSNQLKSNTGIGVGIGIGTDMGLNQSMLLDDQQQPIKYQEQFKSINKSVSSIQIGTDPTQDSGIDQKLLDYQFAINQRQNKMFQTSTSSMTISALQNRGDSEVLANQMVNKLQQIQKQFEELKKQNERRMKQKQEQFRVQLKQIQIQRQIEKARLRQELKIKEQQAKKINTQKQRIQKIRDKLLEIEKQRKQKQRKVKQSLLIGDDQDENQHQMQFQQVLPPPQQPIISYKKVKGAEVSIGQTNTINTLQPEKKIQYIERHHFHYELNTVHNGGSFKPNQQSKLDPSVNTTSTTNLTNPNFNPDQSILLDSEQIKKQEFNKSSIQQVYKKPTIKKVLKCQNVYNLNEIPPQKPEQQKKSQEIEKKQKQRKKSLNMTEILYDFGHPTRPRKGSKSMSSGHSQEQQNLLNMTDASILASYIPSQANIDQNLSLKKDGNEGYENISLNISADDMSLTHAIRQQELLQKIRQYQQRLKLLEQSAKQKKDSIKNIRKSFAVDFGENPNSDNFFTNDDLFEGEFDFSLIQPKGNSAEIDVGQQTQLQKKIKLNMVQCQNQNIINERTLQVRKRKREGQQLKQQLMKKEKKGLHSQLVQLIPMLQKFNLWARQMNRNLQGKIQIQYQYFTNYQIIDALKSMHKSKIEIQVKIYNFQEGRTYKWPIKVFENRFQILQNIFQRFLENPTSQLFTDKTKDPFWDPRDYVSYAVGYLTLQSLTYALDLETEVSLVYKGQVVGYLDIILQPTIDRKAKKLRQKLSQQQHQQHQIYDPRQLLEQDLFFTISIERFRPTQHLPTDKIDKYFISYEIMEDNYKDQYYKTQQLNINKQQINYMLKHSLHNVTQHTLAYLADSPICLTLNLLFNCDEDMANMSSSFISNHQTSLNSSVMSDKILKSQLSSSESPPPNFAKKKSTIILQNPDVLNKIQKEFTTQQKKIKSKAEATNSNSNSNSNKKKGKGNQQCTIF